MTTPAPNHSVFTVQMLSCHPTISVKALNAILLASENLEGKAAQKWKELAYLCRAACLSLVRYGA